MRARSRALFREVHRMARTYHWSEQDILRLSLKRRLIYLLAIEEDLHAALVAELTQQAG